VTLNRKGRRAGVATFDLPEEPGLRRKMVKQRQRQKRGKFYVKGKPPMTKQEVLQKLAVKLDANQAEVRRQLEFIADLPGHEIHWPPANVKTTDGSVLEPRVDLLGKLSETWKQGRALNEVMQELVGLVYPEPPAEQTKPSAAEMLQ
jgi:hypothetical protein